MGRLSGTGRGGGDWLVDLGWLGLRTRLKGRDLARKTRRMSRENPEEAGP